MSCWAITQPLLGLGTGTDVRCMTHNEGWKWVAPGSGLKEAAALSPAHSHPTNYDSSLTAVEKRKAKQVVGAQHSNTHRLSTCYVLCCRGG